MPSELSALVRMPVRPSVAMKANASGIPPKLAATPQNDSTAERIEAGSPPIVIAHASPKPSKPRPERADQADA